MTKKLKYAEIVRTFLPDLDNLDYESLLKEAQQMAKEHHFPMDTPLTAESFLNLQTSIANQLIKDIQDTEDEIPETERDVLHQLLLSKAQMIKDKDSILSSLKDKGLSGKDAAVALSRDDVNILKILSCPHVQTIGGFIVALQCIACITSQ